jgi:hypothetical protein
MQTTEYRKHYVEIQSAVQEIMQRHRDYSGGDALVVFMQTNLQRAIGNGFLTIAQAKSYNNINSNALYVLFGTEVACAAFELGIIKLEDIPLNGFQNNIRGYLFGPFYGSGDPWAPFWLKTRDQYNNFSKAAGVDSPQLKLYELIRKNQKLIMDRIKKARTELGAEWFSKPPLPADVSTAVQAGPVSAIPVVAASKSEVKDHKTQTVAANSKPLAGGAVSGAAAPSQLPNAASTSTPTPNKGIFGSAWQLVAYIGSMLGAAPSASQNAASNANANSATERPLPRPK